MNKRYQIITKLDESNFVKIPSGYSRRRNIDEALQQLHDNIWSMFSMKYTEAEMKEFRLKGEEPHGMCVSDYAWTKDVKTEFYEHSYHKKFLKWLNKHEPLTVGMFSLNSEPADSE